jgi:hypothetical protein
LVSSKCARLSGSWVKGEVAIAYEKSKESEFKNVTQFIHISPVGDIVKRLFIGTAAWSRVAEIGICGLLVTTAVLT